MSGPGASTWRRGRRAGSPRHARTADRSPSLLTTSTATSLRPSASMSRVAFAKRSGEASRHCAAHDVAGTWLLYASAPVTRVGISAAQVATAPISAAVLKPMPAHRGGPAMAATRMPASPAGPLRPSSRLPPCHGAGAAHADAACGRYARRGRRLRRHGCDTTAMWRRCGGDETGGGTLDTRSKGGSGACILLCATRGKAVRMRRHRLAFMLRSCAGNACARCPTAC